MCEREKEREREFVSVIHRANECIGEKANKWVDIAHTQAHRDKTSEEENEHKWNEW